MDGQDEASSINENDEASTVLISNDPAVSPVTETVQPEVATEPVPEPEAVPAQELPPIDAPIAAPEPVISSKVINDKEEIVNEEVPHKEQITEPEKRDPMEIAKTLDHDVLEAAVRLVSLERMGKMREAKIASDKKKVAGNSDRVAKFVATYINGVRRTTIADKLNMSPSKVTDYLQRLIASGRIRAVGKTNDRRFFVK